MQDGQADVLPAVPGGGGDGMGLLTSDGTFLKFDDPGAKQALAELKGTKKKDHLRATVIGERTGDAIKVQSVKLD